MTIEDKLAVCRAHLDSRSGKRYYQVWTSKNSTHYMYEDDARYCLKQGSCWASKSEAQATKKSFKELYAPGTVPTEEEVKSIIKEPKDIGLGDPLIPKTSLPYKESTGNYILLAMVLGFSLVILWFVFRGV